MFRTEEVVKSNDDCYFYYYSTCKKGDNCLFRHCEAALGTEIVCAEWQIGKCFHPSCPYRHMESEKDRSTIPCYWENQPGGCRKPHCVFRHYKFRENADESISKKDRLILPVSHNDWQAEENTNAAFSRNINLNAMRPANPAEIEDESDTALLLPPAVEPLVVSFDGESDSESCTSTPVKPPVIPERNIQFKSEERKTEPALVKTITKPNKGPNEGLDFGIKTLQQIREEKEDKEKPVDDIVEVDPKNILLSDEEKKVTPKRRRTKRKTATATELDSKEELDFKIKTLDEIRKERFHQHNSDEHSIALAQSNDNFVDAKENNENRSQKRHIVIKRDKNIIPPENESKKNNSNKSPTGNNGEVKETVDKPWPSKPKRLARELYQPPKAQRQDEAKSISPKKKPSNKNESYDNICIKTLAEIREERRLRQLQETGNIDDGPVNQVSSSSVDNASIPSEVNDASPRKNKLEISPTVSSNKKVRLNTTKSSVSNDDIGTRLSTSNPSIEVTTDKLLSNKRKAKDDVKEPVQANSVLNSSADEKQSTLLNKAKKRRVDVPSITDTESRVSKHNTREMVTHSSSNEVDEFDLLLDGDDEDVDLNVSDVKDDDLLLELEEMINS